MEMALKLPNYYVEIEEEEMMYLEGGKTYSGAKGWSVIAVLSYAGSVMVASSSKIATTVGKCILSLLSGGPIAWIGIALSGLGLATMYYAGSCFLGAAKNATSKMLSKGKFNIYYKWDNFSPIYIS